MPTLHLKCENAFCFYGVLQSLQNTVQALVNGKLVRGWDDPRLPTLAGMRRRGLTAEGINTLCHELGINRSEGFVQLKRLYHHVRNHLDATSTRALAVLRPLKLVRTVLFFCKLIQLSRAFFKSSYHMMVHNTYPAMFIRNLKLWHCR